MIRLESATDLVNKEGYSPSLNDLAELLKSKGFYVGDLCGTEVVVSGQRYRCHGPKHHQSSHEVSIDGAIAYERIGPIQGGHI